MAIIHDKYVIELKEVIKGYGNDPQEKDPFRFPCDYKFYEIDGVAICEESFKKMKLLEDIAIPKDQYEARLKADLKAILVELQLEIEDLYPEHQCTGESTGFADAIETPDIQKLCEEAHELEWINRALKRQIMINENCRTEIDKILTQHIEEKKCK